VESPPASSGLRDISPALGALPLFPLPQTVLFPGCLLPLHIFEPRYVTMIGEVLETHRALAVVLITEAAHGSDQAQIASVAGAGVIVDHTELPGGRYNILVRGRARVRLAELPFVPPYRRAAAEILSVPAGEVPSGDISALVSTATSFAHMVKGRDGAFDFRLPRDAPPALIADLCAHHLVLDARERQAILETLEPAARVRRVAEALAVQRVALNPARGEPN
jgi:ATP-dependent Lon protease